MFHLVSALAWRQHGAFSAAQAVALGVARSTLSDWRARGSIERRAPGVYVLAGTPATARQRLTVELLAAGDGAFGTSDSALGLWSPELVLPARPIITVPRDCGHRSRSATVIRSRDLHLAKPGTVDGIPVVGVARALLDASPGRTPDQVLGLIDSCRRHSSLATGALVEALEQHRRSGRPGVTVFRDALRRLRREVTDSEFERLVCQGLVAIGVPEPRLHHVVRLPGEDPIELDIDWPDSTLDVELDGRDHIERARQARHDRWRDRVLQRAGLTVARYLWDDYVDDPVGMMHEIARMRDQCRRTS